MKFASSLRFRLMAANIIVKQVVILLAALYLLNAFDGLLGQGIGSEIAATAQKAAARLQKSNPDRTPLRELLSIAASAGTASDTWHISRGGESLAYPAGTAPSSCPQMCNLPQKQV